MTRTVVCCVVLLLAAWAQADSPSPYARETAREIKALSAQEVADYLAGRGLGLARAAELNGYPGPAHVLELAAQLGLTAEQRSRTATIFQRMQARAIDLGRQLVEEERTLDRAFASRTITPAALAASLERIARLQGELRRVHLAAHLEQTALLTPEQIAAYDRLRGYAEPGGHGGHGHGRH